MALENTITEVSSECKPSLNSRQKSVVLIVDDDLAIRNYYKHLLGDEFILVSYGDGAKAQKYIESNGRCDLAIIDNNLGISPSTGENIKGRQLSELLKILRPKVPIIRASGSYSDFYSDVGVGDFFLAKPFNSGAEVLSMVRSADLFKDLCN